MTPALTAAIKRAVVEDFAGLNAGTGNPRVGLATTVYASRFYSAVISAGARNVYGIGIALGDGQDPGPVVDVRGDQEPVMSEDEVEVVI